MENPTKAEQSVLHFAARNERFDWAMVTSRQHPRRIVMRCIEKGWLAKEPDACVAVDGDGFAIQPERWKTAYRLTDAGRRLAAALDVAPAAAE